MIRLIGELVSGVLFLVYVLALVGIAVGCLIIDEIRK